MDIDKTKAPWLYGDMPTVLRVGGFRIEIFLKDHEPAHVHAYSAGGRAKINLLPVSLEYQVGMKAQDVVRVLRLVVENHTHLVQKWSEINAKP